MILKAFLLLFCSLVVHACGLSQQATLVSHQPTTSSSRVFHGRRIGNPLHLLPSHHSERCSVQKHIVKENHHVDHCRSQSTILAAMPDMFDSGLSVFALGASALWLQLWISLANSGKMNPKLSRKIIHTGSAPLFMCLWPLYSADPTARYYASAVPLVQMLRLIYSAYKRNKISPSSSSSTTTTSGLKGGSNSYINSNSNINNINASEDVGGALSKAISRSGDAKEALGGPLIYTIVLLLGTFFFFRESPVGVVAIIQMAAGDGVADIIGRRWGRTKWFFNKNKSVEGTCAFILGAFVVTTAILSLYSFTGCLAMDVGSKLGILFLISVICAFVELIPLGDDNITVPLMGAIASQILL